MFQTARPQGQHVFQPWKIAGTETLTAKIFQEGTRESQRATWEDAVTGLAQPCLLGLLAEGFIFQYSCTSGSKRLFKYVWGFLHKVERSSPQEASIQCQLQRAGPCCTLRPSPSCGSKLLPTSKAMELAMSYKLATSSISALKLNATPSSEWKAMERKVVPDVSVKLCVRATPSSHSPVFPRHPVLR